MLKKSLLIPFLFTWNIFVAQQISTDRPDQTESSSTVPLKLFQVESGVFYGKRDELNETVTHYMLPSTLFRIGLLKGLELRVLSQFEQLSDKSSRQNGISDIEIGAKVQFFNRETSNSKYAALSHLVLPTGSKGLTNFAYGSISKLCVSHTLSEFTEIGYNIGYNYYGVGNGDLTYSLAFNIDLNGKIGLYVEPFGEFADFNDWKSNLDAGFTYLILDNLQFDFSFGTGLNQRMNYLSVGMSWVSRPRK
jgi:hypothetical protein